MAGRDVQARGLLCIHAKAFDQDVIEPALCNYVTLAGACEGVDVKQHDLICV